MSIIGWDGRGRWMLIPNWGSRGNWFVALRFSSPQSSHVAILRWWKLPLWTPCYGARKYFFPHHAVLAWAKWHEGLSRILFCSRHSKRVGLLLPGRRLQKSSLWPSDLTLSGQVMHAIGLMEVGIRIVLFENLVCWWTRTSYGTLGPHPALNSPGLYFVFKCSIHLSHPCSTGFCVQNSDEPVRC